MKNDVTYVTSSMADQQVLDTVRRLSEAVEEQKRASKETSKELQSMRDVVEVGIVLSAFVGDS